MCQGPSLTALALVFPAAARRTLVVQLDEACDALPDRHGTEVELVHGLVRNLQMAAAPGRECNIWMTNRKGKEAVSTSWR